MYFIKLLHTIKLYYIQIFGDMTALWLRPRGFAEFCSLYRGGLLSWFCIWLWPCQDDDTIKDGLIARGGNSGGNNVRGL